MPVYTSEEEEEEEGDGKTPPSSTSSISPALQLSDSPALFFGQRVIKP